ncbi:MAG: contractile injection system tape measure protein [Aureispira sp.]
MAKKEGNHYIEEQIINLDITGNVDDKEVKELQENFIYFYKEYIVSELAKAFDELVPADIDLKIESLELNLGTFRFEKSQDLARQIQRKAREIVQQVVKAKIQTMQHQAPRSAATGRKQTFSKMAILEHFLTKGYYPTWAGQETEAVIELMETLLKKNTKGVAQRILRLKNNKRVIERLYQQFTAPQLQRIFEALYGSSASLANKQIKVLQKRLGKATEKSILSAAIDYVLEGSSAIGVTEYKEREFTQRVLEGVQKRKGGTGSKVTASKVRAGFEGQYSDLQILEYFLEHGAIPAWADVATKTSLQDLMDTLLATKVAGLQRLLERHVQSPNFVQRLIFQFSDEQILQILATLPTENITFIKEVLEALSFVTTTRQTIQQRVTTSGLRQLVFTEVLDYFFLQKKSKFIKKTFLKNVLERLASPSKTAYPTLVKELYRSVRRRSKSGESSTTNKPSSTNQEGDVDPTTNQKTEAVSNKPSGSFSSNIRKVLEQLDGKLQQKIQEERQELRETKRDYKTIERQLDKLLEKKAKGTLSKPEEVKLRQLTKQAERLEQTLLDLEDSDRPLDIEQVVQQRQLLQNQLRQTQDAEQEKLTRRLANTNKELQKLRATLDKDVKKALRDQEKLREKSGSIAQQRLQRITNRLKKYYRAVKTVLKQLTTDQTETTLFLTNINRALRGDISSEEKKRLRQERSLLQKKLLETNKAIEELQAQEKTIEEALRNSSTLLKKEQETETDETISASGTSKLDALIFMLQYGATPWWAEDLPRQTIEELFLEFAATAPQKLLKAFQHIGRYPVVWQRVMNQLSESAIRTVIASVYPTSSKIIFEQANMFKTVHFGQGFERLKTVPAKVFEWGVIVEYLLTNLQGFNAQDFVKEVTLQTARVHSISPTQLLTLTTTIANNNQKELSSFLEWNSNLSQDRSVAALERELASYQQEKEAKEEGTFLDAQQKLELLVEFLSTGRFTERAKAFKLTTQEQFETILIEQIQENSSQAKQVLFNILRLSNARQFIINKMEEDFFWELVFLVKPEATLTAKRHFKDLRLLGDDKNLALEKDVLFNVFISNASSDFKVLDFVRALLISKRQATGRKTLAILTDWKRQLKARGTRVKSSLLLSILLLEVDVLKSEQKEAQDLDLRANLNEQVNFTAKEYTDYSVALVDVLSAETAELQSKDEKPYTYIQLQALIEKKRTEMAALERQLNEEKEDTLDTISLKRNLLQYQASLEWLELRRPPVLRRLENSIRHLKRSISSLQEEVANIEETGTTLEEITLEEDFELSLVERQAQILEFLEQQNPVLINLLEPLFLDLKEEDQRHALFVYDVQRLAANLRDERLQQMVLAIVEKMLPTITPIPELQRDPALDKRQADLLQNFNQQAPIMLWQTWEELESYFQANPEAFTVDRQRLQDQIKKAIRRREEQNFRSYVANLRNVQQNLMRQLDKASNLEALEQVQEELETLWEQQRSQVDDLVEMARDEKTRNDYKRVRRNIEFIFIRIQNTRIRRANAIRSNQEIDPKALLTGQTAEVELLEEELQQVILQIEDKEAPKPKPQQPQKRKRSKEPPKPKPIEEPLQVYNAGMVLLSPYISRLFGMLGYTKGKEWVDIDAQYKAIHILQYLVTGKTEAPENELILNKVMCGFPVAEPVPFGVEFDPKELKIAEGLLLGVIKNWPRMNTLVPNSLRGSFLMREGTIKEGEAKWELKVQKKAFDILLKSIPWGYNFIRLPWNDYFITVEWKLL